MAAEEPNGKVLQPQGAVESIAVSADGRRAATGHADGTAGLWDLGADGPSASRPMHSSDPASRACFLTRCSTPAAMRSTAGSLMTILLPGPDGVGSQVVRIAARPVGRVVVG